MRILILEDDLNRIETFRKKLSNRHELHCVDTAASAIAFMKTERCDVVFLDHDLGGEVYVNTDDANTGSEVV